jgi:type I restriction enzyme M protein
MSNSIIQQQIEASEYFQKALTRNLIKIQSNQITYNINQEKKYNLQHPEEWIRANTIVFLVLECGYPPNRIRTEVRVPRRTPSDLADIVLYCDDECKSPYLVVECKSAGQTQRERDQGIEQLFGNTNSLGAPLALYEEYVESIFFDVKNFAPGERKANIKGKKNVIPKQYGKTPQYAYIAGPGNNDIKPVQHKVLETRIRRAHSIIWAGGKRDPLMAFDEWSKLLFAKVEDERTTPNGSPRRFQIGTSETTTTVANRVHELFEKACKTDRTIFLGNAQINLPDKKIFDVVNTLQDISIVDTSIDSVGAAFEGFFGSVFRGDLGQYFTMRQLARFTVAMLNISHNDYVIDLSSGSGGFLLEVLLQVWYQIDEQFSGRPELERLKNDYALYKVFGIEIHEILSRICKINLLLHHDGHTNIEGNKSCLDNVFTKDRLNPWKDRFNFVVGNPPFGDNVQDGDEDLLGSSTLEQFNIASGKKSVPSEHVILERAVEMLEPGGRLGLILPDGLFNNQGEISNCPFVRQFLAKNGRFNAIVSLPDFAFRKSGAQNKTSILFFSKYTNEDRIIFESAFKDKENISESEKIAEGLRALNYWVFLGEANHIGYTPTGAITNYNDLYDGEEGGRIHKIQNNTILGEWRKFCMSPEQYKLHKEPDCIAIKAIDMWNAHKSNRLDPKYHLFKCIDPKAMPEGWVREKIKNVMKRREELAQPEKNPEIIVKVLTVAQTGELRFRSAGKGNNPPEWLGMYFENIPSKWYVAHKGDVVFSSIDLWKGCIAVVDEEFDGGLVTKEFPIYEITDERLDPEFLSCLLRSRFYQRAFRAITTGHSNRRRTQEEDFENLEIAFPSDRKIQSKLIENIILFRKYQKENNSNAKSAINEFNQIVDDRKNEEYVIDDEIDDE